MRERDLVASVRAGLAALVAVAILAFAAAGAALAAEPQRVAGTSVTLVPLEGFEPADGFSGFGDEETQSSVMIVEMPAEAFAEISEAFRDIDVAGPALAAQGMELGEVGELTTAAGVTMLLVTGVQHHGDVTYDKWIALLEGEKTVMITVQTSQEAGIEAAAVEEMLRSVDLGSEATLEEKLAALPFEVVPAAPFRIIDTLGGSGVLMTAGERDVDPDREQPVIIVALQLAAHGLPDDREQLSEFMLLNSAHFSTAEIEGYETVDFSGGEGTLLSATVDDAGVSQRVAQYLTIGPDGRYIRLLAVAEENRFAEVSEAIEAIAASVAFRN